MKTVLSNGELRVEISHLGAEVASAVIGGFEYMHQPTAAWGGTSPLLFPVCGRLVNSKYTLSGKEYQMEAHGFAMNEVFDLLRESESEVILALTSNEKTLAAYPFEFEIIAKYWISGNALFSEHTVVNLGKETMPFMFGLHPGFMLVANNGAEFDSYRVALGDAELTELPICRGAFVSREKQQRKLDGGLLHINKKEICAVDTLVFKDTKKSLRLFREGEARAVSMEFSDNFEYLCIWTHPNDDEFFLCIEPWSGIPSDGSRDDCFDTHDAMLRLAGGDRISFRAAIKFEH